MIKMIIIIREFLFVRKNENEVYAILDKKLSSTTSHEHKKKQNKLLKLLMLK